MLSSREDNDKSKIQVRGQDDESRWRQGGLSAWSRRKAGGEARSRGLTVTSHRGDPESFTDPGSKPCRIGQKDSLWVRSGMIISLTRREQVAVPHGILAKADTNPVYRWGH